MRQSNENNLLSRKSAFLNNAYYEYVWVFCNGVTEQTNERNNFRKFFKSMFTYNDAGNILSYNAKKLFDGNKKEIRNQVRPKRRWILLEQLQHL